MAGLWTRWRQRIQACATQAMLLALALCAVLVGAHAARRARGRPAHDAGTRFRPVRLEPVKLQRQLASVPIAALALSVLAFGWCRQGCGRLAVVALATATLVTPLASPSLGARTLAALRSTPHSPLAGRALASRHPVAAGAAVQPAVPVRAVPPPLIEPPAPVVSSSPRRLEPPALVHALSALAASPHVGGASVSSIDAAFPIRDPVAAAMPAPVTTPVVPAAADPLAAQPELDAAEPDAPETSQPMDAAIEPFPGAVEQWRPLVRRILDEARDQGRLGGSAAALDDDFVLAVIQQESEGDPEAESWAGAIGLMQVMPFTFAEVMAGDRALTCAIDPAAMWDVPSNVRAGVRYLALAMQAVDGNRYWALAAYNAGIDAVNEWRGAGLYAVPPVGGYAETAAYAQVILENYLGRRPDVAMYVPDAMPPQHVPGALRLLRDLAARRPPRPPESYPHCG